MDTTIILATSLETIAGHISFPQAVSQWLAAGVESYHVDYVSLNKTFHGSDGSTVVTAIPFEGLPAIAEDFAAPELRAAILDSQRNGQKYRDFTRRAMTAGVQGYIAFLRGQRVTYWGRQGDQHTEWFPGAGPASNRP